MQTRGKVGGEDGGKDVCTDEVDVDGGAVNCDVGVAPAAGVEVAEPSVGVSKPDGEVETKLSFFFRNSSLLLAFLLRVEGLILFFATVDFTSLPLVSREKKKEVLMSLKVLPWLASVWQRARHWDTKEGSITAAIFTCSSES